MDGSANPSAREATYDNGPRTAQVAATQANPARAIADAIGEGPFALVALLASPEVDLGALCDEAQAVFRSTQVVACTTAGEIGERGYSDHSIVALAFPKTNFAAEIVRISPLSELDGQAAADAVAQARLASANTHAHMEHSFALLLVDGLSMREDELAAAVATGLGPVPVFGGSAGDGSQFVQTKLALGTDVMSDAALVTIIRTHCPIRVFSLDHLVPTETRMVVTKADPSQRVVERINAEPAAAEFARVLDKDPAELDNFALATHPLTVRLGRRHHVRAIKKVTEDGHLHFFSAIDEGAVLSLAEPVPMAPHLDSSLAALAEGGAPDVILACDCLLRRVEAQRSLASQAVSEILGRHRVFGFSTYGEQFGAMHVNQTMTGVAIYPSGSVRRKG